MSEPNFPYVFEFDPQAVKILPKIEGQSKRLKNGHVRVWFTADEWRDVAYLVNAILDGESNEFTEESNEMEYALPDF